MLLYHHDESLWRHTTTAVAVDLVSDLSEDDRALFKHATIEDYAVTTAETIFYAQGVVSLAIPGPCFPWGLTGK